MFIIKKFLNKTDKHLNEILKGLSIAMVIRILGVFSSYFFTLIIARFYGADSMGLFALSQAYLLLLGLISRLGLDTASIKLIAENYSKGKYLTIRHIYSHILLIVVPFSILISFILFFSASYISNHIINKPDMKILLQITSFAILPFSLLFIHSESFRGVKNIFMYSIFRNMSTPLLAAIILITLYFNGFDSNIFPVISYVSSICLLFILSSYFWIKYIYSYSSTEPIAINSKTLLDISLPMLLTSSMHYILQWTSLFILSIYRPEWEIGVYNVALKISMIVNISLFAINSIVAPKFSELFSNNQMDEFRKTVYNSTRLIFFTSLPFVLLFVFFPTFFLSFFGEKFIFGKWALIFLTITQLINSMCGSTGYIMQMTGKEKTFRNIIILSTTINICMNIILIPKIGIIGAAISSMVSVLIWNVVSMMIIKRDYNVLTLYIPKFLR